MNLPQQQRGVALLAAILLVALGTIIAAAIAFQSAMAARRATASLSFDESVLVAQGAEALAAYALAHDDNKDSDYAAESWGQPFGPTEIAPGVVLAATVEDLQGRFNLNSLITYDTNTKTSSVDKDAVATLGLLLEKLDLEPKWASQIADWIDQDSGTIDQDGLEDSGTTGQSPPYRTANTFVTSTSELLALPGFGRERYRKLAPFVVALPPKAIINVCTASPLLLEAMLGPGRTEWSTDPSFAEDRTKRCWPGEAAFKKILGEEGLNPETLADRSARVSEKSQYFRLTSLITIGGVDFTLYSLLQRTPPVGNTAGQIRVLQRSFTPD